MQYQTEVCDRCGATVYANWIIRHRKSGCTSGIVATSGLTCVRADGCAADRMPEAELESGAAAAQLGR